MRVVLDASVTLSWYFADEQNEIITTFLKHVQKHGALVPSVWPLEVLNILVLSERRGRGTRDNVDEFLGVLKELDVLVEPTPSSAMWTELLTLAHKYQLTVYDAAYLELAQRRQAPLATLDKQLIRAAKEAGVKLLLGSA